MARSQAQPEAKASVSSVRPAQTNPGNPLHAHTAHRTETVKAQPHAQAKGHGPVHNRPALRGK